MNHCVTSFSWTFVMLLCLIFGIAGCGSGSTNVRVLQGSPFQPSVTVLINGNTVSSSLAYASDTGYVSAGSSTPHVQIELPGSTTANIDQMPSLSGANSTFVVVTSGGALSSFVVADNNSAPGSGNANLRVLNASPNLASADVYIVPPGTNIGTVSATVSGVNFQNGTSYQSLAAGNYEIILSIAGSKIIAADSGTVALGTGQVRTVAAIDTVGGSRTVTLADLN